MKYLAHRGFWKTREEQNSLVSFERALRAGYGIETDVRDAAGRLVIAHDLPGGDEPGFGQVFALYDQIDPALPLAINIKADGLAGPLQQMTDAHQASSYFLFDMSVPDQRCLAQTSMPVFTRQSEYEMTPALYESAAGVWLDMFESDWATCERITEHLDHGKQVAIVSPELHGRDYNPFWSRIREIAHFDGLMLCTDLPDQAENYFGK